MPKHVIGSPPFPVRTVDADLPITLHNVTTALRRSPGVSLCVRSGTGPPNRGGYFFHIERNGDQFILRDFENIPIITLPPAELIRFINHVCGRQFDAEMWTYCQSVVNLRQDQIVDD